MTKETSIYLIKMKSLK